MRSTALSFQQFRPLSRRGGGDGKQKENATTTRMPQMPSKRQRWKAEMEWDGQLLGDDDDDDDDDDDRVEGTVNGIGRGQTVCLLCVCEGPTSNYSICGMSCS